MNKLSASSDLAAEALETPAKCPQCGAMTRLSDSTCVYCLLRQGLVAEGEGSRDTFESILLEANVTGKQWRLGHYEIFEEIGRGGMGVIYRARQQHSRRIVAVKRILSHQANSHEALVRFRREAEAAASLDHPNILPIHEISESDEGLPFFSMKFASGGSLRSAASALGTQPRRCVQLMAKVARAIAYAHRKGVLHRDLQPGNILLDENGEPLVSDFGLARWLDQDSDLTRTLETLGTPGYIAPEQAECQTGERTVVSDIYSLGAILFYLLTGRPPFVGPNVLAVIHQAGATPAPRLRSLVPALDRDLETIVGRCLEGDPKARYQSADALADDLEHWLRHEPIWARRSGVISRGAKWVRRNPSTTVLVTLLVALAAVIGWNVWHSESMRPPITNGIAVLPFENLSRDPDNAYFTEGVQDEILTRLAGIANLKVISRASTQHYQNKPRNLTEIAKQLGVSNILEGSVQKAANQVRVSVQLINAQTDLHLWAESYDRKLTDMLGVEGEIAKRIAESLQAKLTGQEQQALAVKPTNNPEAYDAYLRGRALDARYAEEEVLKARNFFEQAIQRDPNFAIAWARLSRAEASLYYNGEGNNAADAAKKALEHAQKLEPNSPETLLALGYYQYEVLYDRGLAKATLRLVREMLPGNSEALQALGKISRRDGKWDESFGYFAQALALDPRNAQLLTETAFSYDMLRQFPAALDLYDRALEITPNDTDIIASKASIYQAEGNLEQAATLLSGINDQTLSEDTFAIEITQLKLERNYGEAARLLQGRLAQFHFASRYDKAHDQVALALIQRLAGDTVGAKFTAEQARDTLEALSKDYLDNFGVITNLALPNAIIAEKSLALKQAGYFLTLPATDKRVAARDWTAWGTFAENLALVQTLVGENSGAISILTQLLQLPYRGRIYVNVSITPALLRLDSIWDPLRGDPSFQKLCEEPKKPVAMK